jgi:DNA-binding transcriptional LysR family regulator
MDLDDIRLFVKVAELKSFVKAATELRIQTSLLSRRIIRLEAALGVRLLQRTTRHVSLTEEGSQFLRETSSGLEQLNSAVDSLNSVHGEAKGRVRVSSPVDMGQYLMANVMPGFFSVYPGIQLEWDMYSHEKNLVEGGIDLSIRPFASDEMTLIEKKLGTIHFQLYRSSKFEIKIPKKITPEDLGKLPWVVFTPGPLEGKRINLKLKMGGQEKEIAAKNIRFRTNSLASVRDAVMQGLGIGLIVAPVADPEVAKGNLVPVRPEYISGYHVDFYAVYPSREYLTPKVRALLDWMSAKFPFPSKR